MLLVDDLAAGGTKNLRHTPRGLVTLVKTAKSEIRKRLLSSEKARIIFGCYFFYFSISSVKTAKSEIIKRLLYQRRLG